MIRFYARCLVCHRTAAKTIVAKFNGGRLSSNAGILVLRESGQRLASPIG